MTENRASVLLRHAFWEGQNDQWRFLVGQFWDVISPLNPGMINYSVGWFGGNIGFRRTQVRAEYRLPLDGDARLTLQGSLNQDIVTDFPTDAGVRRESSNWPVIQARMEFALDEIPLTQQPFTIGLSGHVGETGFDFLTPGPPPLLLPPVDDARFTSWSVNVDVRVPLSEKSGVQGEFFSGANLSTFLGGIGQGVCPCLRVPIRSSGGWAELWHDWTEDLHSHIGLGIDNPRDKDSLLGRTLNQFLFANVIVDLSQSCSTGLEVSYWRTDYRDTRAGRIPPEDLTPSTAGKSVTIDWMVRYGF